MGATAAIGSLVVAAAGTTYEVASSESAKKAAKEKADQDTAAANKLQQEATDKATQDKLEAEAASEDELRKQQAKRDAKTGRAGTILTGGLGVQGPSVSGNGTSKTVLGA